MLDKVRTVNEWIREFNRDETGIQFDLSKYGVMRDPSIGDEILHCYKDWREPVIDRKLHLTDRVKSEIADELVRVFQDLRHCVLNSIYIFIFSNA